MSSSEKLHGVTEKARNFVDRAKQLKDVVTLTLLMLFAAQQAEAQTSQDTIPEGVYNTVLFYVQEDLLDVLDMSLEEFTDQIAREDLRGLDRALYYSYITNNPDQQVHMLVDDQVHMIPNDQLPPSGTSTGLIAQAALDPNDGNFDEYNEEVDCMGANTVIMYGNFGNKGSSANNLITINGNLLSAPEGRSPLASGARIATLIHEMGHRFGGRHENDGAAEKQPARIEVVTERLEEYANEVGAPNSQILIDYITILGVSNRVNFYSNPVTNPNQLGDIASLVREGILDAPQLLAAEIITDTDSLTVEQPFTIRSELNRGNPEEYIYHWMIKQNDQILMEEQTAEFTIMPHNPGNITIELTVLSECGGQVAVTSTDIPVNDRSTSIEDIEDTSSNYIITPNPTNGSVRIDGEIDQLHAVSLYTAHGQMLQQTGPVAFMSLDGLPAGLYYLQLATKSGQKIVQKISKI